MNEIKKRHQQRKFIKIGLSPLKEIVKRKEILFAPMKAL